MLMKCKQAHEILVQMYISQSYSLTMHAQLSSTAGDLNLSAAFLYVCEQ